MRPLKPFEKIKDKLRDVWFTTKSKERLEDKKKALDAALLKLGKEKAGDKVTEIEAKRQSRIDEALQTWETKLKADIESAKQTVTRLRPDSNAAKAWRDKLVKWEKDLAEPEPKRKEIAEATGKQVDDEIRKEASKYFAEVAEAACTEAGFTVTTIGPFRRDLESVPRWDDRYGEPAKFLWTNGKVKDLKQGEATDILDDATNRKIYFVMCDRVEDLAVTDVSRKEWEMTRRVLDTVTGGGMSFRETRVAEAIAQSFSLEALKLRYNLTSRGGETVASAGDKKK